MPKKRILGIVLLLTCSFMVLFPMHGYADEAYIDPYKYLFNFHSAGENVGKVKPLFMKHSIGNYWFEFNLLWTKVPGIGPFYIACNVLLSTMMLFMGGVCLIVINLADWAFSYEGLDGLSVYAEQFVAALRDRLFFGELFGIMIFFLGVSLIFSFGRNEDVAGKLMKVIINLIIAFTLMANMKFIIDGINGIGKLGSDAVFAAFSVMPGNHMQEYTNQPARNAMLNVYDGFFKYNFYKPWQLANYGLIVPESGPRNAMQRQVSEDTEEHLGGSVMQKFFGNQLENLGRSLFAGFKALINALLPEDKEIEGGYDYVTFTPAGIPFRFFIVMLTYVIGCAYGLLLLAIAGTTIFAKLVLLFLAMLAPLIFLLVLIPEWGDEVLLNWVKGMVAAGTYWIVASLMLVMILFMQYQLYEVSGDNWVLAMFLQCILLFTVFRFRSNIWDYIPIGQMAMMSGAENAFFDKGREFFDETREKVIGTATSFMIGAAAISTGNPALAAGMGKTKMGAIGKGIVEDAASIRRDAALKGQKKPGMTRALGRALKNQLGFTQSQEQMNQQTVQSTRRSQQTNESSNQRKQNEMSNELQSSTKQAAAALQHFTTEVQRLASQLGGNMYKEVGNRSVNYKSGEFAVFDKNNKMAYSIKNGEVRDARTDKFIGKIQQDRIVKNGTEVGRIQGGQIYIQGATTNGMKIYEQARAVGTSTKVIQEDVIAKVNVKPDITVDPNFTVNKGKKISVSPEWNVQKAEKINVKPEYNVQQAERLDVKPEFNIRDSKVDLDVTTNVNQNNTYISGGESGRSGKSSIDPTPTPTQQQPTINVNVDAGGGKNITNNVKGDTVHVQVPNTDQSNVSSPSSSKSADLSGVVRAMTGAGVDEATRAKALQDLAEQQKREQEKEGGFFAFLRRLFGK